MSQRGRMRRQRGGRVPLGNSMDGSAATLPPSVELRIDRLVLEGVAPGDRYEVADAVQSELVRLLVAQGAPDNLNAPVNAKWIDAGTIHIDSGMRAVQVGEQIAQAIHGCLGPATNMAGRTLRS